MCATFCAFDAIQIQIERSYARVRQSQPLNLGRKFVCFQLDDCTSHFISEQYIDNSQHHAEHPK